MKICVFYSVFLSNPLRPLSDISKLHCTEWIYTSDSHRKTITPIAKDYWLPTQNFNGHSKTYLYSLTILFTWTLANLILCTHGVLPSCSEATVLTRYTATWAFLESRIRVQRYMNFGISTFVYWMNHIVFLHLFDAWHVRK